MARRRFFILDETCPRSELPNIMGRVVKDKLLPLQKYAPIEPLITSSERKHNPQDIIPGILPKPITSIKRRDMVSYAADDKVKISLTSFFGFDFARNKEERLQLESQEVKRYTLNNPDQFFQRLMEDELYARDVRELLAETSYGRAYFVTGFLTTAGTVWTRSGSRTVSGGFDITIPAAEMAGAPTFGMLDPRINPSHSNTTSHEQKMEITEEEIFAVAYSVVKTSMSFDSSAPHYLKRKPVLGQPKRAGAKHLAMGPDSDEELEEEEGVITLEAMDENETLHSGGERSVALSLDDSGI